MFKVAICKYVLQYLLLNMILASCIGFLQLEIVSNLFLIDRAHLAEKSARKDEKTLFWPPPISLVWLPNQRETKQRRNN